MKLTKYQHACFTVEQAGDVLVVDPGTFATDFIAPEQVVAVVVTHEHPDHLDGERLAELFAKNPNAILYGPPAVIEKITITNKKAVHSGEIVTAGPFTLEFFGEQHHIIHPSMPIVQNVGLLINDRLYYPGDSFVLPERSIDTLALPIAAPWLQISEAIDFLLAVKPRFAFPTHDAIYSDIGKNIADSMFSDIAKKNAVKYCRLRYDLDI